MNASQWTLRRFPRLLLLLGAMFMAFPASSAEMGGYIIKVDGAYDEVVRSIEAMGGTVTHKYENIPAIAVDLPSDRSEALAQMAGVGGVYKDRMVAAPAPAEQFEVDSAEIQGVVSGQAAVDAIAEQPDGYFQNLFLNGAGDLIFGEGITGNGVLVAIIDTGTTNNPSIVPSIAGKVVGGENFVPGVGEPSATSSLNGNHGTWVGSTIAANTIFGFFSTGGFGSAINFHAPGNVIPDFFGPGIDGIPMIGTAPNALLYALKTFPAAGGGAPESRIIAAMDRAITQRRNFNDGMPVVPVAGDGSEDNPFVYDSLPIDIVNMSLGGPTLFAGRDMEDLLTLEMGKVGITLVSSAGNDGHTAMTGGSAGTGIGSLTSGAVSLVANERILRDLQLAPFFGTGIGSIYRPTDHHQMATFSSRGPTADGRIDPDNAASGFAVYVQGAAGGINLVSGTSFSAPNTSGLAALLREAVPGASADDIKDALIKTSDPFFLGDNSGEIDQGAGYVNAVAALDYLQSMDDDSSSHDHDSRSDDDSSSDEPTNSVRKNIRKAGYKTVKFVNGTYSTRLENLVPGQVAHIFINSRAGTDNLSVSLTNITPELPPADQNQLFLDDLFVEITDAPTSFATIVGGGFIGSDTTIDIPNPQTGIVRVAVMGDWTNAGMISADLTITETHNKPGKKTARGEVEQDAFDVVSVNVPNGSTQAVFELFWKENWGHYPTDDVDMILIDPAGTAIFDGATFASPERVVIDSPMGGEWIVAVNGFTVFPDFGDDDSSADHGSDDDSSGVPAEPASRWTLRVTADGNRLKAN